ncbi:uncharacterized protein LAESUDRAFT_735043 [Laetiporus sulphureus 93-53]|uniref:Chromo domain-containing protein n=1 Tax=Laetiporus sulphureus 93-53 TaxID=1314785 RepID=A0A165G9V5_9APHY|nr:uncharacterized protein LAESUDRAFT_735043 [Laetiporus sulphureus 93-53]KZT10042.1 hypothetical protein LAESUDRAFT_735043 [Laetiporus sulphureus 93-53]
MPGLQGFSNGMFACMPVYSKAAVSAQCNAIADAHWHMNVHYDHVMASSKKEVAQSRNVRLEREGICVRTPKLPRLRNVTINGYRFRVSPILDGLFRFMAERHRIFKRRLEGRPAPWTDDPILASYPFTNVFRVYDKTTQFVLHRVIPGGSQDMQESCFRVMLFRLFNHTGTWQLLQDHFGEISWRQFDLKQYESVLSAAYAARRTLYGHAYILPAPRFGAGGINAVNHLRLLQIMMDMNAPERLKRFQYLKDAHGWLCLFPSLSDFTALQLLLDLNMLPHFKWNEDEWVALGPGSMQCIQKIFGEAVKGHEYEAFQYLHATQHEHFSRLGFTPDLLPRLHPDHRPGITMVDLEHSLCECEKYSRERWPNIKGKRTQVGKSTFTPKSITITADLPAHWLEHPPSHVATPHRPPPIRAADGEPPEYEVSHIVAERVTRDSVQYLIRWAGYAPHEDTWQNVADLQGASMALREWQSFKEDIHRKMAVYKHSDSIFGSSGNRRL